MESIEELQIKLEMMKLKKDTEKTDLQRDKLNERIAIREAKESAIAKKDQSKVDKAEMIESYGNMVSKFLAENPIYYDEAKLYWLWGWSSRSFHLVDDTTIMRCLTRSTGIKITKGSDKFEFLENIRQDARGLNPKPLPPNFIQFKDKVVNILTDEEFIATPDYIYTEAIPHKLGNSIETPKIDKLLGEWVHPEHVQLLKEIMAYCMYKQYPIAKEFFLVGSGRNGKSQYIKLLTRFIGKVNTVSTDLDDISTSRFEAVRLFKKSIAFVSETNTNKITKTATLKALTGEDPIKGENKGRDAFDFINHAKLIIATNELPETTDKTDGFYRRSLIIDFPNQFKDTGIPIIDMIPDHEYENLGRQLISVLKKLLEKGVFTGDGSIENKRTRFEGKSNPINEFISQSYIVDINGRINIDDFQINFNEWRINRKIPPLSIKKLYKNIKDAGFEINRVTERGRKVQYILGLEYKEIESDEFGLSEYESQFKNLNE